MKKINYLIVNLVIIVFNSCLDIAHDTRDLKIINKSNAIVYCLISDSDSFTNPYIDYKESGLDKLNKLKKDSPVEPDMSIINKKRGLLVAGMDIQAFLYY